MWRAYLLVIFLFSFSGAASQTCCSGGVPLSGNIGFTSFESKLYQFDLSYDINYLNSIYNHNELLKDNSRHRLTQSALLKAGIPVSGNLAADLLFTFVTQRRIIDQFGGVNKDLTSGIGDAVLLIKYAFNDKFIPGLSGQIGAGPKIPLGSTTRTDERGFWYNADLQPGSGSWDLMSWIYLSKEILNRPQRSLNISLTYRYNGRNKNYLDFTDYQFGNSYQLVLGFHDQLLLANWPVNLGISLKLRRAYGDQIGGQLLANTGGSWIYINPVLSLPISQSILFNLSPEIPVYNQLEGTQLSTSIRVRAGIYFSIKPKIKIERDPLFEGL